MQKQSPKRWGRLSLTAAASSLAIMAATPAVLAQDISAATEQQQVDIPAGPLDDALITAAELFGVTIIAPSELVSGKSSSAITGALNASQTIDQLLSDSDLAFSLSSTGAYVVSRNTAGEARARENLSPAAQDTIVVTGEKFQQSLVDRIPILPQELPFVLNVLDRDFLDARNFTRPAEALTTLPNVQLINDRVGSGGLRFSSRGFEAPILVDNRRQAEFGGSGVRDDSFVERYEVLKGPASIAVGPASTGGVINTVTKSPEADRFTDLMLRVDQFGSLSGEFDVNFGEEVGPDFVLFRVSGAARSFQFDADETKRDEFAIRPVAIFDVTSATSLKVSASYYEQELRRNTG
ncbi:MAG: TonB-dependent receptor, partial [Pseudomonadota bacterium]